VRIAGTTLLLTGATGGLGTALARALAARGAALVLSGRREGELAALAAETGGRPVRCDLSEPAGPEELAREAGAVDILIANAALPASGPFDSFSVAEIDRALMVNLRAPMILARLLGEAMAARGSGHMVFISSLSGKAASVGTSVYSATKFGLRGFSLGLREDLSPSGVGVSCVFPGFVREAGMYADSGASLPRFVPMSTPAQVCSAVLAAIESDRAEVDVAPLHMRAGVMAASVAPALAARVQRLLGGATMSAELSAGQRDKR
jgi:short-subunit dehydrogenase